MVWLLVRLALAMFVLNCLVQCTEPNPSAIPIRPTHSELRTSPETKLPNTGLKQTTRPTVKTTKKITAKKTAAPALVNEFSLNDILFKGRQSNEANAFLKANEQRGKALETTYEHIREQDLNDLEALLKRRNQMRLTRS